jgi:hypothetical protein
MKKSQRTTKPDQQTTKPEPMELGPEPEPMAGVGSLTADTSHFDSIKIEEPVGTPQPQAANDEEWVEPGAVPELAVISLEAFQGAFSAIFTGVGAVTGLESVGIKPEEQTGANGAAKAVYDMALEVPFLRFLVEPGNIHIQRAMVIGMFLVPKVMLVLAEIKARSIEVQPIEEAA